MNQNVFHLPYCDGAGPSFFEWKTAVQNAIASTKAAGLDALTSAMIQSLRGEASEKFNADKPADINPNSILAKVEAQLNSVDSLTGYVQLLIQKQAASWTEMLSLLREYDLAAKNIPGDTAAQLLWTEMILSRSLPAARQKIDSISSGYAYTNISKQLRLIATLKSGEERESEAATIWRFNLSAFSFFPSNAGIHIFAVDAI